MSLGVFTHNHTQTEPEDQWVIRHLLNTLAPAVDVYIDHEGELTKIIPKDVIVVDRTTVRVEFTAPRTGLAAIR